MNDGTGFDPEEPEKKEIGREMVDQSTGLGSVAAHLYRGEMERTVGWRDRLDTTTNWAVTVMSAIVAYAFSGEVSHAVILAGLFMGTVFLFIEARRFRDYDIWRSRVRSLQENLFANALDPSQGVEHDAWRAQLSRDYRDPEPRLPRGSCPPSTAGIPPVDIGDARGVGVPPLGIQPGRTVPRKCGTSRNSRDHRCYSRCDLLRCTANRRRPTLVERTRGIGSRRSW